MESEKRAEIYEHHMKQHRKALAASLQKHGSAAIYFLTVSGASSSGSNGKGRGMFQGPLDVNNPVCQRQLRGALGSAYDDLERRYKEEVAGGDKQVKAFVLANIELDGKAAINVNAEAVEK